MPPPVLRRSSDRPTRFAVAPFEVRDDHPLVPLIADTLDRLVARQNADGSWGKGLGLDRLISTCHTTMALIAGGYSLSEPSLQRARKWLCSEKVKQHNNSYWVLGPLASWFGLDPEVTDGVVHEMDRLRSAIDSGAQPNPDQHAQYFYLRMVESFPSLSDQETVNRYVGQLKESWTKEHGWSKRPDTTSVCYAVLCTFDDRFAATIKADVMRLLDDWSDHPEPHFTSWRNPISTSYTLMNLVESGLIREPAVRVLGDEAVAWLRTLRTLGGMWSSAAPYGGIGDIKSDDYATAAIVRGLIAYASMDMPQVQGSISAKRVEKLQKRNSALRKWTLALAACATVLGLAEFGRAAITGISSLWDVGIAGLVIGVIGVVIAILAWMFPDPKGLYYRLRRS